MISTKVYSELTILNAIKMKKSISILITITALASFVCSANDFDNPLEQQDFKYSEKNIQKYIQKAADSKKMRIEDAFANATGEGLREGLIPHQWH